MSPSLPSGFTLIEGVSDDRYSEWLDAWLGTYGSPPSGNPEVLQFYRATYPPERAVAIIDDEDGYVATNTSLHRDFVLPGGATVPMAACTSGSCHPTLARLGLMSVTLDRLHRRAAEEGKALCAGGVSEWPIYERFGYGPATWYDAIEIDVRRAGLLDRTPGEGIRPRRVSGKEASRLAQQIYARQAVGRPGEVLPPSSFWDRLELDQASSELETTLALSPPGGGPRRCAAVGESGFVSYRIIPDWTEEQSPSYTLQVIDFLATDEQSAGALWRHLFTVDLVQAIHMWRVPLDDPLRWWVRDARRIRRVPHDGLWLRLIDVPTLLGARAWSGQGKLTLTVHDSQGYTEGTYLLDVQDGHGSCQRIEATAPDLEMDVSALGAILLGGTRAADLRQGGRISAPDPRHARLWDALAIPERTPFISYWF